jgi:hypothetical protein
MTNSSDSRPAGRRRIRGLIGVLAAAALMTVGVTAAVVQSSAEPAEAATVSFSQCNGHEAGPAGAATAVNCSVTIVNTINALGGTSAVAYVRSCALEVCTGDITSSTDVINAVHQCNASNNGGGSATTCSVDIINNISASAPAAATALTLNQCVGSGQGGGALMTGCIESTQGSPTVTQCNGSGNGGGATMVCTASGTVSAAFPISVDQCNGSENGGGSTVNCTVTITTNVIDTDVGGTPGGETPGGGTPGGGETPGGGTPGATPGGGPGTGLFDFLVPGLGTPGIDLTEAIAPPAVVVPPLLTG